MIPLQSDPNGSCDDRPQTGLRAMILWHSHSSGCKFEQKQMQLQSADITPVLLCNRTGTSMLCGMHVMLDFIPEPHNVEFFEPTGPWLPRMPAARDNSASASDVLAR